MLADSANISSMMMKLCMLFVLFTALASAVSAGEDAQLLLRFQEWLVEHKEAVAGLDPAEVRENWLQNAKFVEEHNLLASQGLFSYKVSLNAFAHKVSILVVQK